MTHNTTRNAKKRPSLTALKRVLILDGIGVTLLVAITAVAVRRRGQSSKNGSGWVAVSAVGIIGWVLAATAVGQASQRDGEPDVGGRGLRGAERLIAAGFALNTAGCTATLAVCHRSRASCTPAALALLIGGTVLSGLYRLHLSALEPYGVLRRTSIPEAA